MPEQIEHIALRIRDLREISGYSIETLAKEFGISVETYQAYESGKVDIPVGFLHKAAARFGVDLTTLLTGQDPKLHIYSLVRKGQGLSVERRKQYKYQNLAYNFIHKKAEPFLVTVAPEPANTPFHFNSHPGQEFNYVLKGRLKVIIGDSELILEQGDALFFDSNYPHAMKALDNATAEFLAIIL